MTFYSQPEAAYLTQFQTAYNPSSPPLQKFVILDALYFNDQVNLLGNLKAFPISQMEIQI